MRLQNSAAACWLALALGVSQSAAHEAKDRVSLQWKRDPKSAAHRVGPAAPAAPELPPELSVAPGPPPTQAMRHGAPGGGVEAAASRAADEMAREAVSIRGRREYWRAGFARGVTAALDDPRLGAWDRDEGVGRGRSDAQVRALGDHLANEAAEGPADGDAEARVRERFMDLSSDPRLDRADPRGRPTSQSAAPFEGPFAVEPVLDDVFAGYPPARCPDVSQDGRREIDAWRVEPASFGRSDRPTLSYDARWKDPAAAFSTWRDRQPRGSPWSRYSPSDREAFRAAFADRFEAAIREMEMGPLRGAWRAGFDDGWRYGAAVQAEWAYRRGYAEGFDGAVRETATIAYPYAYERAYDQSYAHWFDEWSRTAHAGIGEVRLADESGDGVYEPGERVLLAVEVVNYGGGVGTFDLIASGSDLGQPSTTSVRLVGRGRVPESQKLTVRVGDRVPPRTRSAVTVTIADARVDAPLYVSRPFEIAEAPAFDLDRLGGRVTFTLAVQNNSRRDAPAVVRVEPLTVVTGSRRDDVGLVPSGGSKRASVTFNGIHPLDLIGAESRWRVSAVRADQVDDAREIRLPPVATDLTNPDLMDFMIALARTPEISRSDVTDSRALMMQRLRADWERACDASGNPYKRDFDTEGASTVLGQLVRVTEGGGHSYASPQVFAGMGRDVEALSDDLPGAHPLLRKWLKKLAKRLG